MPIGLATISENLWLKKVLLENGSLAAIGEAALYSIFDDLRNSNIFNMSAEQLSKFPEREGRVFELFLFH